MWLWFFFTDDNMTQTEGVLSWIDCGKVECEYTDNIMTVNLQKKEIIFESVLKFDLSRICKMSKFVHG